MRPPSLGSVPASIPLAHACRIDDRVRQTMGQLAARALALQEGATKRKPTPLTITQMADAINNAIQSEIDREIGALMEENPLVRKHYQQYALATSCTTSHDFFGRSVEPLTTATMEVGFVYTLCANFLEHLKAERPALYPLLRLVLNAMHSFAPVSTPDYLYEIIDDQCATMKDEAEDKEDRRHATERRREAKREKKTYEKHVTGTKLSPGQVIEKMAPMHKKLAHLMSGEENLFVLAAMQFLQSLDAWKAGNADVLDDDDDNSYDMTSFFYLIWSHDGPHYDYIEDFMNGSGELSAPHITFSIRNRKDIRTAIQAVRTHTLLEALMASAEEIWTK